MQRTQVSVSLSVMKFLLPLFICSAALLPDSTIHFHERWSVNTSHRFYLARNCHGNDIAGVDQCCFFLHLLACCAKAPTHPTRYHCTSSRTVCFYYILSLYVTTLGHIKVQ